MIERSRVRIPPVTGLFSSPSFHYYRVSLIRSLKKRCISMKMMQKVKKYQAGVPRANKIRLVSTTATKTHELPMGAAWHRGSFWALRQLVH